MGQPLVMLQKGHLLSSCLFQSFLLATFSNRQRNVDFGFRGAISFLSKLRLLDVQHTDKNPRPKD